MLRRTFLSGVVAAGVAPLASRATLAQAGYPTRPVRLIVPAQVGGVYDLISRMWADRISPSLGTVMVENRAVGSATVAVAAAAKTPADGYNLLIASNATHILQPAMMTTPTYDPVKDFVVISAIAASWTAIVVTPSVPAKTVQELVTYVRANPGKLNFGYSGIGDTTHIAGELFKQLGDGLNIVGVPYRGMNPAIREMVSGHLQMGMPHLTSQVVDLHRTGQLRILAVNAPKRLSLAPDLLTAPEAGLPEMTAATFFYLYAPAGTPRPILERVNRLTQDAVADEAFRAKLEGVGFDVMNIGDLDQTAAFAQSEQARWTPIAQKTGIKIEQ